MISIRTRPHEEETQAQLKLGSVVWSLLVPLAFLGMEAPVLRHSFLEGAV